MAFGLLNSIIPPVGQPDTLHTGTSDTLTVGKVSISSKNATPARIQLAYEESGSLRYFEYNKKITYGQTYETQDIHLGAGQKLVVRSDQTDINFLFYGQTVSDALHPVRSGVLSHIITTDKQKKSIFTAPTGSQVNATLSVCNMGVEASVATIGVSNATLGDFDSTEYIEYNIRIEPGQTYTRTDIKIKEGQTIVGFSNRNSKISFVCHGQLFYAVSGLLDSDDKMILGNARITGNLGVGITATSGTKFHVLGDSTFDGAMNLTGNLVTNSELQVKGIRTRLLSDTIQIKDNNIELAYIDAGGFSGTATAGDTTISGVTDFTGILPGAYVTLVSAINTVTLQNGGKVVSTSSDSVTLDTPFGGNGTNSGMQFNVAGANDYTADEGGITLKSLKKTDLTSTTSDKWIKWKNSNEKWNLSTGLNIPASSSEVSNNFSIDDVVVLNSTQVLGFAVTTTHSPNYVPSGISTAHLTTEKSTDELVTAREKNVSVSAYFASSFDF